MVEDKSRAKIGVIKRRDGLWAGLDHLLSIGRQIFPAGTPEMKQMGFARGHTWWGTARPYIEKEHRPELCASGEMLLGLFLKGGGLLDS